MSAMPIGMPGWPELAAWTASMARKRMALARSRRLGVVMGGKSREAAPGDSRAAHCPTPPRRSKNVGRGYVPTPPIDGRAQLSGPCGPRPSAFTGREARGAMTWAPGGNALGGECPPAPAFGRRLLLYFAPKDIPTRVRLSPCFQGTQLESSLFRQPALRRDRKNLLSGQSV